MQNRCLNVLTVAAVGVAVTIVSRAETPHVYAIRGAKIVTAAGAPIPAGTLVIRNGLIEAVGAAIQPPPEAVVIEANGLTVYPGLIDMGSTIAVDTPASQPEPQNLRTTAESERWKRGVIFHPEHNAADQLRADSPELSRLASLGVTSVLALPAGAVVKGRSALVNVAAPADEPQIGSVGDHRRGLQVVKTPVALHIDFGSGGRGGAYPASLMGVIAFVRQSFLDAQHQRLAEQRYERLKTGVTRPAYDPSLGALQPVLEGRVPVAFEADAAREILRALRMAEDFKLDTVITGAREADQVAADLKSRSARVIYGLDFPTRSRTLAPDADEPVQTLRTRAQAPKVPAALAKAGILFAFSSAGLRESRDFVRNAARAVKEGLPAEAALRALTIDAATIAGAADRLGSLEKGKIANVVVVEGDLFEEKMKVKHVFVDGRPIPVDDAEPQPRGRGGV